MFDFGNIFIDLLETSDFDLATLDFRPAICRLAIKVETQNLNVEAFQLVYMYLDAFSYNL